MNLVRKIGNWLWLNKERMVLAVMVGFLIFRVYQVVSPTTPGEKEKNYRLPDKDVSADIPLPGEPPAPPPAPNTEDWTRLWRFNPFIFRPTGASASGQSADDDINLILLNLRESGPDKWMAEIQTESRKGWYVEGQPFETYELLEIDPTNRTVTVFSERHQRSKELALQQ